MTYWANQRTVVLQGPPGSGGGAGEQIYTYPVVVCVHAHTHTHTHTAGLCAPVTTLIMLAVASIALLKL